MNLTEFNCAVLAFHSNQNSKSLPFIVMPENEIMSCYFNNHQHLVFMLNHCTTDTDMINNSLIINCDIVKILVFLL